jgi:membrane protein implicated in regulation of membrane protease activity
MKRFFALLLIILPFITMAHPGHGDHEGFTIKHYFTQPEHLVFTLAALALVVFALGRRALSKRSEEQKD